MTLDLDKFGKVLGLIEGGATDGERAAARSRAEAMAGRAGLSLSDAMAKFAGRAPAEDPTETFSKAWANWEATEFARRLAKQKAAKAAALREYGTQEAIFAETARERELREAVAHLVRPGSPGSLDGWGDVYGPLMPESAPGRQGGFSVSAGSHQDFRGVEAMGRLGEPPLPL